MADFWYNLRTREVEQGATSSWKYLLGPYSSREAAAQAMERVRANNEAWDEDEDDDAGNLLGLDSSEDELDREHWQDDGGH